MERRSDGSALSNNRNNISDSNNSTELTFSPPVSPGPSSRTTASAGLLALGLSNELPIADDSAGSEDSDDSTERFLRAVQRATGPSPAHEEVRTASTSSNASSRSRGKQIYRPCVQREAESRPGRAQRRSKRRREQPSSGASDPAPVVDLTTPNSKARPSPRPRKRRDEPDVVDVDDDEALARRLQAQFDAEQASDRDAQLARRLQEEEYQQRQSRPRESSTGPLSSSSSDQGDQHDEPPAARYVPSHAPMYASPAPMRMPSYPATAYPYDGPVAYDPRVPSSLPPYYSPPMPYMPFQAPPAGPSGGGGSGVVPPYMTHYAEELDDPDWLPGGSPPLGRGPNGPPPPSALPPRPPGFGFHSPYARPHGPPSAFAGMYPPMRYGYRAAPPRYGPFNPPPTPRAAPSSFVRGSRPVSATALQLMSRELTENDYETLCLLDDGIKKKGLSTRDIKTRTKTEVIDSADKAEELGICCICQEDYAIKDTVRRLHCTHVFHMTCVDQWLKDHGDCCICKQRV